MLYFNVLMVANFLKALESKGSLVVTVVCSAINFLVTGLLGNLILGEEVNITWCLGASLIIVGILLILFSQGGHKEKERR
jgi:drug/metabolite transporter (DMT)-like permease